MSDATPSSSPSQSSSEILEALERIENRLDRLEQSSESARAALESVPPTLAAMVDSLDGRISQLASRGVDVDERMRGLMQLLERLSEPGTMDSVQQALELARNLPQGMAAAVDVFDGVVARMAASGIDVDERLSTLVRVAERLTAPEALELTCEMLSQTETISRLLESGIFAPGAINVVGRAANALTMVDIDHVQPVGAFGALKALGSPEMKQALGVLIAFGHCFGKSAHRTLPGN